MLVLITVDTIIFFLHLSAALISLSEPPPASMTLYLCLPLLVVLLHPARCLYNCSSEYERTPGGLTISQFTFSPDCLSFQQYQDINPSYPLNQLVSLCVTDNSDLTVDCGARTITLEINLCTAQWAGFNTTDLALNGNHNTTECLGSVDTSVDPPVIRYQLPVNHSQDNPCRQSLQVRKCPV